MTEANQNPESEPTEEELQKLVAEHMGSEVEPSPNPGQDHPGEVKEPNDGAEVKKDPETPPTAQDQSHDQVPQAEPEAKSPEVEPTLPSPPPAPYHKLTDMEHPRLNQLLSAAHLTLESTREELIEAVEAISIHAEDHPVLVEYKARLILWLKNL